jgi:hypothetical protein
MASPFPFTSGQVLTAAQLNSISEATAFTPSWTNFTPGNATESWYYIRVNDFIFVYGQTVLGSTSSMSADPQIACPEGTLTGQNFVSNGIVKFGVSGTHMGSTQKNGNNFLMNVHTAGGTYVGVTGVNATAPGTFTTGSSIRMSAWGFLA